MNNEGQPSGQWLKKVTPDQNMSQLSELENVAYDTLRQLFLSGVIQPGVQMGYFNPNTDRIVLGGGRNFTDVDLMSTYFFTDHDTTTGGQEHEWIVPAGYIWIVLTCSGTNATRADAGRLHLDDQTTDIAVAQPDSTWSAGAYHDILHDGSEGMAGVPYIVLGAGDSITLHFTQFVGGDNTDFSISGYQIPL
jgi:hypothetical protein